MYSAYGSYKPTLILLYIWVLLRVAGETFGFIHIEAAALGLPVLGFDMGANRESIVYSSSGGGSSGCSSSTGSSSSATTTLNTGSNNSTYNLIQYRPKRAVEDLSLAIFRVFIHSLYENSNSSHTNYTKYINKTQKIIKKKRKNKASICECLKPVFTHWNVKQHSYALIQALQILLL